MQKAFGHFRRGQSLFAQPRLKHTIYIFTLLPKIIQIKRIFFEFLSAKNGFTNAKNAPAAYAVFGKAGNRQFAQAGLYLPAPKSCNIFAINIFCANTRSCRNLYLVVFAKRAASGRRNFFVSAEMFAARTRIFAKFGAAAGLPWCGRRAAQDRLKVQPFIFLAFMQTSTIAQICTKNDNMPNDKSVSSSCTSALPFLPM